MKYNKGALSFQQQIELLQARGLIIADTARAARWLGRVSYYHLSAYYPPFESAKNVFQEGATFDEVATLYNFDRKLRLITMDAIERIEVAVRTQVTYALAHHCGAFGYTNSANFQPRFKHANFMNEVRQAIDNSHEDFVSAFFNKYEGPHLPVWMVTELLSFGAISYLYSGLSPPLQRQVANRYGLPSNVLASWLHSLSYVRNVCAHHCRFWNRELAIKPMMPKPAPWWPYAIAGNNRPYCVLVICSHLLKAVAPNTRWRDRVVNLLKSYPSVSMTPIGIPENFDQIVPWAAPAMSA